MKATFPMRATEYLKAHSKKARWHRVLTVLSCIVVFCTVYALILPAITMAQETAFCGHEAHVHEPECYETVCICGLDGISEEELAAHAHGELCYPEGDTYTCPLPESPAHTHDMLCFDESGGLLCGLDESEGHRHGETCMTQEGALRCVLDGVHVHSADCYEERCVCGLEEHEHTLSCYSDPNADTETAAVWERTVPQELSGVWADDVLAAAKSQLGYTASVRNYQVDENNGIHGYTRYGAWYGYPYGEWCAMFVSFSLHYGGVKDTDFPYASGCVYWTEKLVERELFAAADSYTPRAGDLVFFDGDGDTLADHVGIVLDAPDKDGLFRTIEGNIDGCVQTRSHAMNKETLFGFGLLPENPEKMEDSGDSAENGEQTGDAATPDSNAGTDNDSADDGNTDNTDNTDNNAPADEAEGKDNGALLPSCGLTAHAHTEGCYDESGAVVCGMEPHTHGDGCYPAADDAELEGADDEQPNLGAESTEKTPTCGLTAHTHGTECYAADGTCICELDEHVHAPSCYPAEEEKQPICGLTAHTHGTECYAADGTCICELDEHVHAPSCYPAEEEKQPICGLTAHTHGTECYAADGTCICELDEHVHAPSCYPAEEEKQPTCGLTAHTHGTECYAADGTCICELDEHVHAPSCYPAEEEKQPTCGKEAHAHTEDCYDESGAVICGREAHAHDDSCYAAAAEHAFTYTDSELTLTLTVAGETPLPEGTELAVQSMDAESIALLMGGTDETDGEDDAQSWLVRYLALVQDGELLDTAGYTMTAEITVSQSVLEPLFAALNALEEIAPEADTAIALRLMQEDEEAGLKEVQTLSVAPDTTEPVTLTATVQSGTVVLNASVANPQYTVQYYANIPVIDKGKTDVTVPDGLKALTVFNTDNGGTNKKGNLPKNHYDRNPKINIYLEKADGKTNQNAGNQTDLYKVKTTDTLTQMYTDENFKYVTAPNPRYINKLEDNADYTLKELWVLNEDKSAESTEKTDWTIYKVDEVTDVHFTNREDVANNTINQGKNVIYIADGAVIRLVYDVAEGEFTTAANFYDYDISSGKNGTVWNTGATGINSKANYPATSANGSSTYDGHANVFAFGNVNCGTGMGRFKFDNLFLNAYSAGSKSIDGGSYEAEEANGNKGCTFGLAESYDKGTQRISYNKSLLVPDLFSEGNATGKTSYVASEGSSLTFKRVGDTYTLSKATVGNGVGTIENLEQFFNPSPSTSTTHTHIFTNNFWPLDNANKNRADENWGKLGSTGTYNGYDDYKAFGTKKNGASFPSGDDGRAHNWFFGMMFAVEFTLDADYIGPLDYTFFGDDDMWVFLDSTLVCDIGGVHSSVGEYVNLWDYLQKDGRTESKTHTLTFFYTERGASGSTCYMNFTLPSVSGVNIEQKTASLRVEKTLSGSETAADAEKEFDFEIRFYNANGNAILDDYSYTRYDKDDKAVDEPKLVLHDGSTFQLKAGEYILIDHLPLGLRYTVTELNTEDSGYTVTNTINGVLNAGVSASGTIIRDAANLVTFTNTRGSTGFLLQKQDAHSGSPLAGASFQLKDSSGKTLQFTKDADGVYTLATKGTLGDAQYYIALADAPQWVVGKETENGGQGTNLVLRDKSAATAMKVTLHRQPDGSYSFRDVESGAWIDLDKGALANETVIHLWGNDDMPTSHDNQKWFLLQDGSGRYTIRPRKAVLANQKSAMNLSSNTRADGQEIWLYAEDESAAQYWSLVPVSTVDVLEVNSTGVLNLKGLAAGTYTLNEVGQIEGFKPLTDSITITVDSDGKITINNAPSGLVSTDASGLTLYVKNEHEDVTLTLEKQLVHSETKQDFEFTVSYTDASGLHTETFKLKGRQDGEESNDQNTKSLQIPYGATVTITEGAHDGFTVTYKNGETVLDRTEDGNSCTITMTSDVRIVAVNEAGYALPSTGGAGARGWYAAGLMALFGAAGAAYVLYGRRRRGQKYRR